MKNNFKKMNNALKRNYFFLILIFFASFLLLFTEKQIWNVNSASRFMTMESIVEQGTLAINEKHDYTGDKIFRNENCYSSKPPMLSVIGSAPYYVFHKYFNIDFHSLENYNDKSLVAYLMTLILSGIPFLLLLFYFYKILNLIVIKTDAEIKKKYRALLIFGLGLGTLYMPYTTTLNNHTIAGCFLFISFYYLLKIKFNNTKINKINKNLIFSGFFVSLATVIDIPTGFTFLVLFFFYFLFTLRSKKIIYYILASIPIIIIHFYFNFQITGDFLPAQLHSEYWKNGVPIFKAPIIIYIFNIFIGARGLFFYSPILLFSFYAIYKIIRNKKHLFRKEAILIFSGFIMITLFYIIRIRDYGGCSYGFRWFIAVTPLIYFFTTFLFIKPSNKFKTIFLLVLILSIMISVVGLYNPWLPSHVFIPFSEKPAIIHSPFLYNLISIFSGAEPYYEFYTATKH